jgi:Transposase DDE domain group 1
VVTNLPGRGKHLYEQVYCAHGKMENLIKDMKLYTRSDKTAYHRWQANQFRLFLHMGAYWILHGLRLASPRKSRWRTATFATIRLTFVKIACRIEELKTKIKLSFGGAPAAGRCALPPHCATGRPRPLTDAAMRPPEPSPAFSNA